MKKVIVMGATGMIGQALIRQCLAAGLTTLAIDRPCEKLKKIPSHPSVKILECDIARLAEVKPAEQYDAFIHLGWKSTSTHSRDDVYGQTENIKYALDAVKLAKRFDCTVFVGAGSQAEYGRVEGLVSPQSAIRPENGYGIAKFAAGALTRILCGQLGIRHNWARILSVYGPGDNDYTMIMHCVRTLLAGEKPIVTECGQMWDYLYCDDVAKALLAIADKGRRDSVYCIGSGRERRMREYVEIIRDAINPSAEIGFGERAYNKNQVMRLLGDIAPLTEDTGFVPEVPFEEGIRRTIEWCRENG